MELGPVQQVQIALSYFGDSIEGEGGKVPSLTLTVTIGARVCMYWLYRDWFDVEIGDPTPETGYHAMGTFQDMSEGEVADLISLVDAYLQGGPPPPEIPELRPVI